MHVRPESPSDSEPIRRVHEAAFGTKVEADLVDLLRGQAAPIVSLVAEEDGSVVGHILFSPVTLPDHADLTIMGLAPMAVRPDRQRRGVGSTLVTAGLEACRAFDTHAVVVLGHATYYPRFGFVPASRLGIRSEYDVPDEVFMAMELQPRALAGRSGTVRYHPAFGTL